MLNAAQVDVGAATLEFAPQHIHVPRQRLDELFLLVVSAIRDRDLAQVSVFSRRVAEERFNQGFDIGEVQAAFNALEEAMWRHVVASAPPEDLAEATTLVACGADDLGGVSPCSIDHINPDHPWPAVDELRRALGPDAELVERLCIHPRFVERGWYSTTLAPLVRRLSERLREQQL